jgi:glycosyltransferase involved in cell wall biosynthesis
MRDVNGSLSRILHINDYPAGNGGGTEVLLGQTVDLLRKQGLQVETFTSCNLGDKRLTALRYVDNPASRRELALRLKSFQPDVVHLHNFYHHLSPGILSELAYYKRRFPLRVVMTAHDYHLVCPNSGGTWFTASSQRRLPVDPRRLREWSYLLFRKWDHRGLQYSLLKLIQHIWHYRLLDHRDVIDVIISPSRYLQALFARLGRKTILLPPPAPPVISRRPRPSDTLHLVFVGRIEPEKGLSELLESFPTGFPGTFNIIGDGSEMGRCREICARRGLENQVRFLGRRPHSEVLDLIAQAHVLVLPSLVLESYAIAVVEALSVGTNLLVSDRGAASELVQASGVGYLFRPGKPNSLQQQLDRISQSQQSGTLNSFDVSRFLEKRGESAYVRGLLQAYAASA